MGAIFGAGTYFIIIPAYEDVGKVNTQIEEKNRQIDEAMQLMVREIQIDETMAESRERAANVNEGFFPEMTTTEAVTMVQTILNGANYGRGFTAEYGIHVTDIEEGLLSLQVFSGGKDIKYALREFATLFSAEEAPAASSDEEEFNPALMAAEYLLGANADELEILDKTAEFLAEPISLQLTIVEMLKGSSLSAEERQKLLSFMREILVITDSGVGMITAEFTLRIPYNEYLDFLDYLHAYPLRMEVNTAILFQDNDSSILNNIKFDESTGLADIDFKLFIYVVKPMELPEVQLPDRSEAEEDDGQ